MSKDFSFSFHSVINFYNFLDKFRVFDDNILIEIDQDTIKCKYSPEEDSIVKYFSIPFTEVFVPVEESFSIRLKMKKVKYFQEILDFFLKKEDVKITITTDFFENTETKQSYYNSKLLKLYSENLGFDVKSAHQNAVSYISDDIMFKVIANKDKTDYSFRLKDQELKSLLKFIKIDPEELYLTLNLKDDNSIVITDKSFHLKLDSSAQIIKEDSAEIDYKFQIEKKDLTHIDLQNYLIDVLSDRLILSSEDNNLIIVIANNNEISIENDIMENTL